VHFLPAPERFDTFLIAVGAGWSRLSLPGRLGPWTSGLLSCGTHANCFVVILAAIFGASKTMPIEVIAGTPAGLLACNMAGAN
jgi:hypothetical protein